MTTPRTVGDLIARDLSKKIEEIIKLDQEDQQSVHAELAEYIATDRIREDYRLLLKAIADGKRDPIEGIGVWVSGFFGSGKSSFAKNLGYVLADRSVLGHKASELLKTRLGDARTSELIDFVNVQVPTEVVMFDVQTDRASGGAGNVSISQFMYRSLLRTLGYAEDFDIAELEQSLETDGRLDEFVKRFEAYHRELFQREPDRFREQLAKERWRWAVRRKMAEKMSEASLILHQMNTVKYPEPQDWARSRGSREIEVTPALLVEKIFELCARRRPGKALTFIIDEVGAYVARSTEKLEDLRAVVEQIGKTGKNLVRAGKAPAPVWVIVTSQEKLDDVVAAIDSKRVELAKLQDRFKYRVDLAPADIREVATQRVLAKNDSAKAVLSELYRAHEGELNNHLRLERSSRRSQIVAEDFHDFYPYPPHFIDLSIDIMSGIRIQPGSARHLGGSNRTIIKQTFEMLASERTQLAQAEIGRLVTLDLVFDLVEGNLSSEKQKDVSDIAARFGATSWDLRVAKVIALLEFVRDLPRTEANIAAMLYARAGGSPATAHVATAVQRLREAQFVRMTEEGWKLQTEAEKTWDTQRRALDPRPREKAELRREMVEDIFSDPKLKTYKYRERSFRVGLTIDGVRVEDGQVPVRIVGEDLADLTARLDEARSTSRQKEHLNDVFWIFALPAEIDELAADVLRSRSMVGKYDQLRGQGRISPEESSCLATEKNDVIRLQGRLKDRLGEALQGGTSFFRGVAQDGAARGRNLAETLRHVLDTVVPDLYPKLEMGARPLKGTEAEDVLKAANLAGVPSVLMEGEQGLGLVTKADNKFAPNPAAPIAKEVLDFVRQRAGYGEKVSGKLLEEHFGGIGYGWDRDMLRLVLAVLLRAGAIEVTHQGRRFRNHQDPLCRAAFAGANPFRSASFSPRESIAFKTLAAAAEHFEQITGQEVDVEEGSIASAIKKLAESEEGAVQPLLATAHAAELPVEMMLAEYEATLRGIREAASDDCVRILASEGKSLRATMAEIRRIREAIDTHHAVELLRVAKEAVEEMWPVLESRGAPAELREKALELQQLTEDASFYISLNRIEALADAIVAAYQVLRCDPGG